MGIFGDSDKQEEAYGILYEDKQHEGNISHELVAGAAAFYAMKKYQEHLAAAGDPASHALAKEMLAGIIATEVDRLVETKGLDAIDRERAKKEAEEQAYAMYDQTDFGQKELPTVSG